MKKGQLSNICARSDTNSRDCTSSSPQDEITAKSDLTETPFRLKEESKIGYWRKTRVRSELSQIKDKNGQNSQVLPNSDDTSDLYLM